MAKYKNIRIELYKRDITVFIGSHEEFKEWIKKCDFPETWNTIITQILKSDDNAEASYWYNNNNGNGIIELKKHPETTEEICTAVHECLHCVIRVLSYIGIPCVEYAANEAYTYLLEYILTNVLDYKGYELVKL